MAPDAAARLNAALARAAEIVTHDWLLLVVSDFDGADDETFRILTGIARGNDLVLALVHDPSAHETPASGRIVVGDGRLQVELDLADARVRRNLAGVGGERIARLLAWQERLDAAILPVSAERADRSRSSFGCSARRRGGGRDEPGARGEPGRPPRPVAGHRRAAAGVDGAADLGLAGPGRCSSWPRWRRAGGRSLRHRRATAWRRAALAELARLAPGLEAGDPAALAGLQTLLRRVALVAFPRVEVARLTGEAWSRLPRRGPAASSARWARRWPRRPTGRPRRFDGAAAAGGGAALDPAAACLSSRCPGRWSRCRCRSSCSGWRRRGAQVVQAVRVPFFEATSAGLDKGEGAVVLPRSRCADGASPGCSGRWSC